MAKALRTPQSEIDLWEIAEYIARDNPAAAGRLLDEVDKTISLLADFPGMGPSRDELMPHLRSFPVHSYVLFYRPNDDGIELVRVIHGARDLDQLFNE
jgi:toxin ParE1/3/4